MTTMATGQKSYNCQEDSNNNPVADSLITLHTHIVNRQEEVIKLSKIPRIPTLCACGCNEILWTGNTYKRGHCITLGKIPWNKGLKGFLAGENHPMYGKHHTEASRKKMSSHRKGQTPWNKGISPSPETIQKMRLNAKKTFLGKKHTEEENRKNSEAHKGKRLTGAHRQKLSDALKNRIRKPESYLKTANKNRGKKRSESTRIKMSMACMGRIPWDKGIKRTDIAGVKHPMWRGGKRLAQARAGGKRRRRGFILLIKNNPFHEPVHYHHIHPDLPYVVPCPERIHKMFNGNTKDKAHFQNVNAMLGFRFEGV